MDNDQEPEQWRGVDEGWGRKAVDFAALTEPSNCREYVAMHSRLDVRPGEHLLDMACGSGLAVELATVRGAVCAGIDAAPRLVAIAADRSPEADLRFGDMNALPWPDDTFDVVTSFRGIWGTTPGAVTEALRVLKPGGRIGITVWGHLKVSPGAWVLSPFTLADEPKVANQAAMVALGRPGVGEELLADMGFEGIERFDIPFAMEFADPEHYARAIAATGPAYEAIQAIGEEEFVRHCIALAAERVRDGLPLRAEIKVVGYLARKPANVGRVEGVGTGFLALPIETPELLAFFEEDLADLGYVMNGTRLWSLAPQTNESLFELIGAAVELGGLSFRQRGILVTACASTMGDSYCSLAWGNKLSAKASPGVAGSVLRGDDVDLDASEKALAAWARKVVRDPNGIGVGDVQALRDAGFEDQQVFGITLFVALRLAFSTVNDALGARPDAELFAAVPDEVRDAVSFGRPPADVGKPST